ncbi:thiosulfohydrolase SoxB [Xanthobacter dioxanivorans]|uniref:Thiosulfohydrolase SoxB n=1 Tax=Xanthobacter dioxanivorans TaxID=2528964 RepID=A0A974PPF0_9HYPH|nr:thiosulfohydrolase SoxB [Xanthobacter dioxanivorans]QRG06978.1 thiosulfohydrolase SoxB [Xanthobacter dioxanivorans]
MISRRDFLSAGTALAGLLATSGAGLAQAVGGQLTQNDLLKFGRPGTCTILHVTDIHAQLNPLYFREPSINLGVGDARGVPPHLTDTAFLTYFNIKPGTRDAYALTSEDFTALARSYGRMGGADRLATLIKAIRAERGADKVLLLDGGDGLQGSWSSLKTRGEDMVRVFSALGLDAMVGHWEFTYGADRVTEIKEKAPFAFLAQNVRSTEWGEPVFDAVKTFEKGGAKIAVIGQAFPRTPIANPRWMIPDWEFGIREEEMQKQVDAARAGGADVVVVLSHNGFDVDRKMASRVKGIDVILTAHTHDAMPAATEVGKTLLIATGSHGKFLSRLDLDVKDKSVTGYRFQLIPVFSDVIAPDPEMAKLVADIRAPYARDLAREVGRAESLLYRRGNFNGTFDDMICDALMQERDAEIALSPGFRWGGTLLPGDPITFEAISNATAITYPACYRNAMTGRQLKDVLEDVADNIFHPDPYFQGGGDMVRVGGVGYAIDVSKGVGQRISGLTFLKSGKPLDADKTYTVAGWASIAQNVEGPPVWEMVERYVAGAKTVKIIPNASVKVTGA